LLVQVLQSDSVASSILYTSFGELTLESLGNCDRAPL